MEQLQDQKMVLINSSQLELEEAAAVMVVDIEEEEEEEEGAALPGFRFHPTDEELVSFYLRRKVEKKPFSIDIIKQIDLYKYNPWDLPRSSAGEKEWYFYCKRGRKYRNSVRPNRVTCSGGFWKATGIDRPIYDSNSIIGLKKSLVYYRGSAGKGTKTDWMMHEFRLPPNHLSEPPPNPLIPHLPEAEVWTLCRIFKRNRKYTPDWRDQISSKRVSTSNSTNNSPDLSNHDTKECYISFTNPVSTNQHHHQQQQQVLHYDEHERIHRTKLVKRQSEEKIFENTNRAYSNSNTNPNNHCDLKGQWTTSVPLMDQSTPILDVASNFSSPLNPSTPVDQVDRGDDGGSYWWEDLSSLVDFAIGEIYS